MGVRKARGQIGRRADGRANGWKCKGVAREEGGRARRLRGRRVEGQGGYEGSGQKSLSRERVIVFGPVIEASGGCGAWVGPRRKSAFFCHSSNNKALHSIVRFQTTGRTDNIIKACLPLCCGISMRAFFKPKCTRILKKRHVYVMDDEISVFWPAEKTWFTGDATDPPPIPSARSPSPTACTLALAHPQRPALWP